MSTLEGELAYLKRLLGEPEDKPAFECRNQIAMIYHQQIDVLTRECQRKQAALDEQRQKVTRFLDILIEEGSPLRTRQPVPQHYRAEASRLRIEIGDM